MSIVGGCRRLFSESYSKVLFKVLAGFLLFFINNNAWADSAEIPPKIKSFIESHCLDCHSGDKPRATLSLEVSKIDFSNPAKLEKLSRVHDRIQNNEMPPPKEVQPSVADRKEFLSWIDGRLKKAYIERQGLEGRVLVRRLNRSEYENTLHDLLGIQIPLKDLLPEDNLVAGFDKISSGLEISATHLVRYQLAADRALEALFPNDIVLMNPLIKRWSGKEFLESRPKPNRQGMEPFVRFEGDTIVLCATLYKHGSVTTIQTPLPGRYKIRASVSALNTDGKPIPVLMGKISSDRFAHEKLEHVISIQDAPANKKRVIEVEVGLPRGEQIYLEGMGLPFFSELKKQLKDQPVGPDFNGPGLAVDWIELEGPLDAGKGYQKFFGGLPRVPNLFYADTIAGKTIKTDWSKWNAGEFSKPHNRLRMISKDPKADATRLIREFIPRAFRSNVSEELFGTYIGSAHEMLDKGEPLEIVLPKIYKSVLCSPYFLMLIEKPGALDDYALASRLSYFIWDSMPDDELLDIAKRGELKKPNILRQQTERLLRHPKSNRFTESFTGQWLDLRKIHEMKPDNMYGEFDDKLAWSMPEETKKFFQKVLDENLPVSSFFDSSWTMLNERLAKHYGIDDVVGMDLRKVELPVGSHRGGIITHASVLKLSTNATYTSPVKRGVWVLERILGLPPAPPPPDVAAIEPDIRGAVTIRQQLEKHKTVEVCASCHLKIDPPGFALENFDVIGGWRDFYRTKQGGDGNKYVELKNYPGRKVWMAKPVEASGDTHKGEHFSNIDDYKKIVLLDNDQIARNLAGKLLVYSTGAILQYSDREVIEQILGLTKKENHAFRSLVHEVVQSRVFKTK